MSHGKLFPGQATKVRRYIRSRVVHDLGCGPSFDFAEVLLNLGAAMVVGIDKEFPDQRPLPEDALYIHTPFERFKGDIDVAFVSWPVNYVVPGFMSLIASARTVIYLGSNTDGNACGTERMFRTLTQRQVVAHVPERRNTLIVYGKTIRNARKLLLEEQAGLDKSRIYRFEEDL